MGFINSVRNCVPAFSAKRWFQDQANATAEQESQWPLVLGAGIRKRLFGNACDACEIKTFSRYCSSLPTDIAGVEKFSPKWPTPKAITVSNYQAGSRPRSLKPESELTPQDESAMVPYRFFLKDLAKRYFEYHPIQSFTEACYFPVSEGPGGGKTGNTAGRNPVRSPILRPP